MSNDRSKTPSETADQYHLELARAEGEAYQQSLRHKITDIAHTGGQKQVSDYVIGFTQEPATGAYRHRDGELEFLEPTAENCHLAVAVSDGNDGRFVPSLTVRLTLTPHDGEEIGPIDLPFTWNPGLYQYGTDLTVPGDGTYDLSIEIEPAEFERHDRTNGERYAESVDVRFEDVDVKCGQK